MIFKHRVQSQFAGDDVILVKKSKYLQKKWGKIRIVSIVVLLSIIWLLKGSAKVKVVANPGDNLSMVSYSWGVSVPRK